MRSEFLEAMSKAANSVYVVTTDGRGGMAGLTVSAVTSVSADTPTPSLLICVNKQSSTATAIRTNGAFCVNLLAENQAGISNSFAGFTDAKGIEKFSCASWKQGVSGCPVLVGCLASFDCKVVHDISVGSHHVLVGELVGIGLSEEKSALLYANRSYGRVQGVNPE